MPLNLMSTLNWISNCDMIKFHELVFSPASSFQLHKPGIYNGIEYWLGSLFCVAKLEIILNCIYPGLCHIQETKLLL